MLPRRNVSRGRSRGLLFSLGLSFVAKKNRLNDPRSRHSSQGSTPSDAPEPISRSGATPLGTQSAGSTATGGASAGSLVSGARFAEDNGATADPRQGPGVSGPSPRVALLISGAIAMHFVLILASYLAVVRPSELQSRLVNGFAPYLRTFHWTPEPGAADAEAATEGVAFFLARGDGLERSYRLQFSRTVKGSDAPAAGAETEAEGEAEGDAGEAEWYDAPIARGFAGGERSRRHSRYLATVVALGMSDQNELAARLLQPIAGAYPEVDRVRVIRLPNIMTNVVQDAEPAPYAATLIREGEVTRFVREPQPRLRAEAIR